MSQFDLLTKEEHQSFITKSPFVNKVESNTKGQEVIFYHLPRYGDASYVCIEIDGKIFNTNDFDFLEKEDNMPIMLDDGRVIFESELIEIAKNANAYTF